MAVLTLWNSPEQKHFMELQKAIFPDSAYAVS